MEKRKNGKRRQKLITASWFSFPQYTCPLSRCIQNLKNLVLIEAEKSVTEIFIGEKEKLANKGNDKEEEADSLLHNTTSCTQHCTKFQNPRCSCFWEIFDTNFPMYYIGVRDGKNGKRMQKLISASWFSFPQYTWSLSRCIQNLENGQIKRMISRRRLILSYTIQQVIPNICTKFQNPRFSSSWQIFDEKKKVYKHTHTNTYTHTNTDTEKTKTIYPHIYFVYQGYNNNFISKG